MTGFWWIVALVLLWIALVLVVLAFCSMASLADRESDGMSDAEFWERVDNDGRFH